MDERRDLVDREELRRRIKANESAYDAWSYRNALYLLDAMPAVECPRGWTRDEVLAELDADPDAACEYRDTFAGNWHGEIRGWVAGWINPEVPRLNVRVRVTEQAPEKVPLTQLVGRTIHGEKNPVTSFWRLADEETEPPRQMLWSSTPLEPVSARFPDGTLDLDTGRVRVYAEEGDR
jgi:hypothetical protein